MTEPHTVEVTRQCTCGEVAGEDRDCYQHGTNSAWALASQVMIAFSRDGIDNADDEALDEFEALVLVPMFERFRLASTPPLPATEMVEAVARAICKAQGHDPDQQWEGVDPLWKYYSGCARASIPIVIAAERERCAKVAEAHQTNGKRAYGVKGKYDEAAEQIATAIRSLPLAPEG